MWCSARLSTSHLSFLSYVNDRQNASKMLNPNTLPNNMNHFTQVTVSSKAYLPTKLAGFCGL